MESLVNREVGGLGKPRYLVMGMDPGIKSCGFALLDLNNQEILEMGSRLFDAPTHPKTKQSMAVIRRGYRSTRRNIDRTQDRLKHCLKTLKRFDVVPEDADKEFFHTVKGDKQPILLRTDGLNRLLTSREWALVLYSLCKRRGYIPHGEGSDSGTSEDGKVLAALKANERAFADAGYRTVGEWLASLPQSRNRGGNYDKCVTHAQLTDEVRTLFEAQRGFGSPVASQELEDAYIEVFDWERSREEFDKRTYGLVGTCSYFPNEKRAARCTLTSEMVAAYGALGNITIVKRDGSTHPLSAVERDQCIDILFAVDPMKGNKTCAVKYGFLRKRLDLESGDYFKGVPLDDEKNREVFKPKGWRSLRSVLHETNRELLVKLHDDRDLADAVMEAVAYSSSVDVLKSQLSSLDLSNGEIESICAMPYSSKVLNGYGNRSKKALDILLGCFEDPDVLSLTDAEDASGLGAVRMQGAAIDKGERLIPYETWIALTGRTNNNPVVIRALSQMRKVVNAVCRKWGVPDEIHVELDRELRLPKKAKDEIAKAKKRNEKDRQRVAAQIAELLGCSADDVKGDYIEKYRLWEEQECFDIYSGEKIEVDRLIREETYTQIDHVLPFSRTGDNSRHNKVLVLARSNQLKREQTPYEWMTSNTEGAPSWDAFKRRVEENKKLSRRKKNFLLEKDLVSKEGEFQSRNMTDTAYMSREVCAYLSDCLQFPDDGLKNHIVPIAGRATAWLRRQWGLNFGATGEKDRSDDRHHATDACVIAACSRSLVIKTAKVMKQTHWQVTRDMTREQRRSARMKALEGTMPWSTFANEVRERWKVTVPTRFVPRKGRGELYGQTVYSYLGVDESGKDLGRKKGSNKKIVMGNAVISKDGKSMVKISEMLCLRLWFDPDAKGRGGKNGRWYSDPVYKADLGVIQSNAYIPRVAKAHRGRKAWSPVPQAALRRSPVVIYLGDVVKVGDVVGRFAGFDIDSANWSFVDCLDGKGIAFPTVGSLTSELRPEVIREKVLGNAEVYRSTQDDGTSSGAD